MGKVKEKKNTNWLLNTMERVSKMRMVRIISSFVIVVIFLLGFVSAITSVIISRGVISNSSNLMQEEGRVMVSQIKNDGSVLLLSGKTIPAREVSNTYPILHRFTTWYIEDVGLFLPVSVDNIWEFLIGYLYIWGILPLVLMIVSSEGTSGIGNGLKWAVCVSYYAMLIVSFFGYNAIIDAYAKTDKFVLYISLLQMSLEIVRVLILVRCQDKWLTSNRGVGSIKKS